VKTTLSIVLALLIAQAAAAQSTPAPAKIVLADLAWIAGHWVDDREGRLSEEIWTEPAGDSMLGLWRYVDAGKAKVFELLAITAGPEGVVLRLRHFDPQMVAREGKDAPVTLKLVSWMRGEARFEGPAVGAPGRIAIHYRQKTADTLSCTLEKEGEAQEFVFRRAPK
jgi:hypothetical protein